MLRSAVPPSVLNARAVLCQTPDIRVFANGETRFLQFRGTGISGTSPWRNNEAVINCKEVPGSAGCPKASRVSVASAAQCPPCPCTPLPRVHWLNHGFGYVQLLFDAVTRADERCQRWTPTRPKFRLLQIGLGGGTFPTAVRRRCHAIVDVVEKQADVVAVAERFFGFAREGGRLLVADGLVGLRELAGNRYDAVVVDCMIQGITAPGCKSAEFVRLIATVLRPTGSLAQWAWADDRARLRRVYQNHFANVTDTRYMGGIGGVLVATGSLGSSPRHPAPA